MTAADLLATLRALGATVELDAGRLDLRRDDAVPSALRPLLKEHEAALAELLRREAGPPGDPTSGARMGGGTSYWGVPVISEAKQLAKLAERVVRAGAPIGLALATTGPDAILHSPALFALALPDGQHVVDLAASRGLGPLGDALRRSKVLGHDLQVPLAFLLHHHGLAPTVAADAEILSKLVGGGVNLASDDHTLDALARARLRLDLPALPSAADIAARAPGVVQALAVRAGVLQPLIDGLAREVAAAKLTEVASLEHQLLPSVVATVLRGVGLDAARLAAVIAERESEQARHEEVLFAAFGDVNLRVDAEVLEALQRHGLPVEKTGRDTLAAHLHDPVAQALVRYRQLDAFARDLGPKMLANAAQYLDGRMRPRINRLGAPTGRMSYSGPNLQGVEKGDAVRRCIVPAPGHVFVVGDYAAIDLRALADHTKDPALVAAFKAGADLHRATAARLAKKSTAAVTDDERGRAKEVNFGIVYGMGALTLAMRLFVRFGEVVSVLDAQRMLDAYRLAHPRVAAWQEHTRRWMPPELRTASGRLRRFDRDDSFAQRLNAPIQGTVADGLKRALIELWRVLPSHTRVVLTVHDEIVVETPREHAAEVAAILRRTMEAAMAVYVKAVPIVAEVSVRSTWAEGSKLAIAARP